MNLGLADCSLAIIRSCIRPVVHGRQPMAWLGVVGVVGVVDGWRGWQAALAKGLR
jgi:hypothetical protein